MMACSPTCVPKLLCCCCCCWKPGALSNPVGFRPSCLHSLVADTEWRHWSIRSHLQISVKGQSTQTPSNMADCFSLWQTTVKPSQFNCSVLFTFILWFLVHRVLPVFLCVCFFFVVPPFSYVVTPSKVSSTAAACWVWFCPLLKASLHRLQLLLTQQPYWRWCSVSHSLFKPGSAYSSVTVAEVTTACSTSERLRTADLTAHI